MVVFRSVANLKEAILAHPPTEFFDNFVLGQEVPAFDMPKKNFVREVFDETYGISPDQDEIVVVGSSKLGFALHDKIKQGQKIGHAFRSYGADSDIDVSICSQKVFSLLWHELSSFVNSQVESPYDSGRLGDYLVYGWLRTDKLPVSPASFLMKCNDLKNIRARVRKDRMRGHAKVNFGVYYDVNHLRLYQSSSIAKCRSKLEKPL